MSEVIKPAPDRTLIRRALIVIRGLMAPVMVGVGAGVTAESSEEARHLIEALSAALR